MILINSGAYLPTELQAEFGPLPACFIPLANKKLLEFQVDRLKSAFPKELIVVSLPEQYPIAIHEQRLLNELGVSVVTTPDSFNLCEAILYILNTVPPMKHLRMLHGDTLFETFPTDLDLIDIAVSKDNYNWAKEPKSDGDYVWTGYFAFASPRDLACCLALSRGDFVAGVRRYMEKNLMSLHVSNSWLDLGHVNTYFKARAVVTTERAFNSLNITDTVLTKTSANSAKISAEALWFESVPSSLKKYTPQLIDHGEKNGRAFYQLEYLAMSPLNELFVHGQNPLFFWAHAFEQISMFLKEARNAVPPDVSVEQAAKELVIDKTQTRLELFVKDTGLKKKHALRYGDKVLPSLSGICEDCYSRILGLPHIPAVLHGDLCLSNMLIDMRSDRIKVIDPRGIDASGNRTIYGDQKYDLAKLTHSIIGMYDFIISGYYTLEHSGLYSYNLSFSPDQRIEAIQRLFWNQQFVPDISVKHTIPLVILLFLSMLPLHNDDTRKQKALFANALRLYAIHCEREDSV